MTWRIMFLVVDATDATIDTIPAGCIFETMIELGTQIEKKFPFLSQTTQGKGK